MCVQRSYQTSCHNLIYCYSLCLMIFGLAPSWPLFLDFVIRNPWLILNPSTAMHFLIRSLEGPRDISLNQRGGKSRLDWPCLTACFLTNPRTTFMTTQLRSSVWWLLSRLVHILSICDNLRSKETAHTLCNEKSLFFELGQSSLISYMPPHY
jgi:hypothetical protein